MLLTVIVPLLTKGIERMLERELEGIDSEIIEAPWDTGILLAQGDFVCLLEADSALKTGSIRESLELFTGNPLYRKLAMVSPMIDVDYINTSFRLTYGPSSGLIGRTDPSSNVPHAARVGYVPGSIIRKTSLEKIKADLTSANPFEISMNISLTLWDSGLRLLLNPDALYYTPIHLHFVPGIKTDKLTDEVKAMWAREMIS